MLGSTQVVKLQAHGALRFNYLMFSFLCLFFATLPWFLSSLNKANDPLAFLFCGVFSLLALGMFYWLISPVITPYKMRFDGNTLEIIYLPHHHFKPITVEKVKSFKLSNKLEKQQNGKKMNVSQLYIIAHKSKAAINSDGSSV